MKAESELLKTRKGIQNTGNNHNNSENTPKYRRRSATVSERCYVLTARPLAIVSSFWFPVELIDRLLFCLLHREQCQT